MNTNKIIFAILGAVILLLIIMLVIQLNRSTTPAQVERQSGDFNIWILDEDRSDFENIIRDFKDEYTRYSNTNIGIESFSDRETYSKSIISALGAGIAPDIFLLNNREFSPLQNHINAISPSAVSPNDFRRDFHPIFSEDLIVDIEGTDALIGVPVGYQVPALYYNRRNFPRSSELTDWGRFSVEMESAAQRSNTPPIALGVGTTISRNTAIFLSFLAQEGVGDIEDVQNTHTRQVMSLYRSLGLIGDETYIELAGSSNGVGDIEHFATGNVASILAYPRDIKKIADIGFQSNMLFVSPFPLSEGKRDAIAIDYDYFVMQRNTSNVGLAEDFMSYIASDRGQELFMELFPHQMPAHSGIAIDLEEREIHPSFNVIQRNFLRDQTELVSFGVGNNSQFSKELTHILDRENGFDSSFQILKSHILCALEKYRDFQNLSTSCR